MQNQNRALVPQEIVLQDPSPALIEAAASLEPRDLVKAQTEIQRIATSSGRMAQSCIYCRPVGKKDGKQQFVLGPSIRLAEIGQQQFGAIWLNGDAVMDHERIRAKVIAIDLRTLNAMPAEATKSILKRDGKPVSQAQIEVLWLATLSIARRNALLQHMRPQLESVLDAVKLEIIRSLYPDKDKGKFSDAFKTLADEFAEWGVAQSELQRVIQHEATKEDGLVMLIGMRNAIRDGLVQASDVFTISKKPETKAPEPAEKASEETVSAFVENLRATAAEANIKTDEGINAVLFGEFSHPDMLKVPEKDQSKVLEFFQAQADEVKKSGGKEGGKEK